MELPFKIESSFSVPKGSVYFVPEFELRRFISPDGLVFREELVYWKQGAAVLVNVGEPDAQRPD